MAALPLPTSAARRIQGRIPRTLLLRLLATGVVVLLLIAGLQRSAAQLSSSPSSVAQPRPIISLTSSPLRLYTTLPLTLNSLLRQSLPPSLIALYLPFTKPSTPLPRIFHHPLIRTTFLTPEEDLGPASKLLLILRELLRSRQLDQQIIVVDDDHIYTSSLVERLVHGFAREGEGKSAVGLRGWRVREDCRWGVGPEDYERHVVEGWKLATPSYRVGVLTANEGYLITPRMFLPPSALTSGESQHRSLADLAPVLSFAPPVPTAGHLVDDIWISGHLASLSIPRLVVSLPAPSPPSLDITPPPSNSRPPGDAGGSPLEQHLASHGYSRSKANDEVLTFFESSWAAEEGGKLWFNMDLQSNGRYEEEAQYVWWPKRAWSALAKVALWWRERGLGAKRWAF